MPRPVLVGKEMRRRFVAKAKRRSARDRFPGRGSLYGWPVSCGLRWELMTEADEGGSGPLRFGVADRDIDHCGCLPFVEVMVYCSTILP